LANHDDRHRVSVVPDFLLSAKSQNGAADSENAAEILKRLQNAA
jgi:hypothetical protein